MSLLLVLPASAQVLDREALRQKELIQQRARNMARELVSSTLDVQLRQLEENGLQDLEVYGDIRAMRGSIDGLVQSEMADVVELLASAQSKPQRDREADFVQARTMIRTIVLKLSAERQNLLRRLRIAELAEQVRRLIVLQTRTKNATAGLPRQPKTQQETLALKTNEDQRDVKELFLLLVETLGEIRSWGGAVSTAATDGLRLLKAAEVGIHLDKAGDELSAAHYESAVEHQEAVIRGLLQLLKVIERAQGLIGSEHQAVLERIRDLARQQEAIREETKQTDSAQPQTELIEKQKQIEQELGRLADALHEQETAQTHLEQAGLAAEEATADLFEGKQEEALAEQGKVLGHLAALEEALLRDAGLNENEKSAAELAEMAADLEKTKTALEQAADKQEQVPAQAKENPAEAARQEQQIAGEVEAAGKDRKLPPSVEAQIADAAEALKEAAQEIPKPESAEQVLEDAAKALDRALAETEAALSETKRRELAVRIGELARAAEVLERAAAAEREISADAGEMAAAESPDSEAAKALAEQQQDVKAVADKVAEGLKDIAPKTAEATTAAARETEQAGEQLNAAAGAQSPEQAQQSASKAAEQAKSAAGKLTEAAALAREEVGKAAAELAEMSGKQLEQLVEAREGVEQALAPNDRAAADRLGKLTEAQSKVQEAAAEQQRAAGRPEAAEAMQLARAIGEALQSQERAAEAAADAESGKSLTPLAATTKQQEVADAAEELSKRAAERPQAQAAREQGKPDPISSALETARQNAAEAAKQLLDGKSPQAESTREAARQALEQARELARTEAEQTAAAAPTAPQDAFAQRQVGQRIAEAMELAGADAPQAGEQLAEAAGGSEQAEVALQAGAEEEAAAAQSETGNALEAASRKLAEAMQNLGTEGATELAEQAGRIEPLAAKTRPLDSGATNALRDAGDKAKAAAKPQPALPQDVASGERGVQQDLERAAANLAAKEQQVRRDQAIAEAIGRLAQEQQLAAQDIAAQRETAMELPPAADEPGSQPTPAQQQAARALAQSTDRFAQAQQATGEGAVEVSRQKEVANPPLREALELASSLPIAQELLEMLLPEELSVGDAGEVPEGDPLAASEGTPAGEPSTGEPADPAEPGQPAGEPVAGAEAGAAAGDPGGQAGAPQSLGTGFVPKSPEVTAKLMAGPKALAQMAAALPQPLLDSEAGEDALQANAQGSPADQQPRAGTAADGGVQTQTGRPQENQWPEGALQQAATEGQANAQSPGSGNADAATRALQGREEAWFAKLPPELRQAIRANAQGRAPRAYEQRLRRYFESVDQE